MGTRLRIIVINLIGGLLACGFMLLLLPAPAMAAPSESPQVINHRDLIAPPPKTPASDENSQDIPEGELPVTAITLKGSASTHEGTGGIYVLNQTDYSPDYAALLSDGARLTEVTEGPQVLILHTHGTEAYSPEGTVSYDPSAAESVRSENLEKDVVAVGAVMTEALEKRGIEVLHDETLCDIPSFNQAYTKSLSVAEAALEAYPSIRVILDIHRDSMITSTGVKYRPITMIAGKTAAQMMLVVGTPQNGKQHDGWCDNLRFAMALQKVLVDNYPGLMRPINLRADRFNQHLRPGAVLVEIGSCGNNLAEAQYAAELFAAGLAQLLK